MGRASPALRPATRPPTGEPLSDPHEPAGADLDESLRFYGLRRAADGSHTWIRRQAPRPESAIPARTLENLAACAALGLAYWSEAPGANRLWAIDDDRQPHQVTIDRRCQTASARGVIAHWIIDSDREVAA
ncbi:MAG: hypothetical protein JOY55_19835 [Mycobacterium sp.]|nr:hypothetical protein [Mycobacterium sp.]MBV8294020.1 hypothetical protein [Mycobacterium sp.]